MNIGTAVPTTTELSVIKHHFVQHKSIKHPYTVGDFEREAIAKLDTIFEQNNIAILVGGSGLYADAILSGLDKFPDIDPQIRVELQNQLQQNGITYLVNEFQKLDPIYYQKILSTNPQTLQNPHRIMRFLEVCVGTNLPYSSFLKTENPIRNFVPILIALDANREVMYNRINQRVDSMMHQGLLQEANKLYPFKNLNALQTVGYKELFQHIEQQITLAEAVEEIKKNTRRFAKRQLTWFKRYQIVKWFDFQEDINKIITFINNNQNQKS